MQNFDATAVLATIHEARDVRRHRCNWGKSRLVPYRAELVQLRRAGASYDDIVFWLRTKKRVKVANTTVMRFLAKLPEMGESNG